MTGTDPDPDSQPDLTQENQDRKLSRRDWLTGLAAAPLMSDVPNLQVSDNTSLGEQEWAFEIGSVVYSSPAVADVTEALDEIPLTALAKRREDRHDDIIYLRDALQELFDTGV